MWSSVNIAGSPRILLVDATEDVLSDRLYKALKKTGLQMELDAPLKIQSSAELSRLKEYQFNCILLFVDLEKDVVDALRSQQLPPYLLAVSATERFDPEVSESILKSNPLAIAPLSIMSPREAGLFYLKFFTELKLHSTDSISGKMVWFSFSKAKELLKRRRYTAKFGVRC
jgi:hypothetical protein